MVDSAKDNRPESQKYQEQLEQEQILHQQSGPTFDGSDQKGHPDASQPPPYQECIGSEPPLNTEGSSTTQVEHQTRDIGGDSVETGQKQQTPNGWSTGEPWFRSVYGFPNAFFLKHKTVLEISKDDQKHADRVRAAQRARGQ